MRRIKRTEGAIWKAQHSRTANGFALLKKLNEAQRTPKSPRQIVRVESQA